MLDVAAGTGTQPSRRRSAEHQRAADELLRVCRPAGTVALLSWTPEGMLGELFRTMKPFAAPPPPAPRHRRCGGASST